MFMTERIHEFLFDCKLRELSDLTRSNYEKQLNAFHHYVMKGLFPGWLLCIIGREKTLGQ